MKNKIIFIIVIIFVLIIQSNTTIAQELNYSIRIKDYEYDIKTQKTKNHGWIDKTAKISDDLEMILGFTKPDNYIYMATNAHLNLKFKLEDYINKNYNSGKPILNNISHFYSRYAIYLRPILNNNQKVKDALFSIEETKNIKGNEYAINSFLLSESDLKNSKEFGHLKDGRSIYDIIKDNNDLKMLIYETPEKIYYVSIEFTVKDKNEKTSGNNNQPTYPIDNDKTIVAPFYYDIKYQNSKGEKTFLDNVKQNEEFIVQAAKKDTINPVTQKNITLIYNLKGQILPLRFLDNELTIKFILTAEDKTLNNEGNETNTAHSSYIKEITLKPNDVVEIKLKENWPKMETLFGYDPVTLKKYYYDYRIKNQSFFLKLVHK